MKKNYQAPSMKVVPLMPRQMLCGSLTISNTETSTQWGRVSDSDWDDQVDR